MSTTVENAPLLELIAELRWRPTGMPEQSVQGPAVIPPPAKGLHEFFMRFAGELHGRGYTEVVRLVPEPFPMLVHQPVFRFDPKKEGGTKSLYQVGPGLFSANAVPPYESWSSFGPIVRSGVEALLKARDASESESPFVNATLRYIDAFGPLHTGGRDSARFAREVLGIDISLPEALTQHLQPGAAWKPFLQFHVPVEPGVLLALAIGDGIANDAPAILMDTSVIWSAPLPADVKSVMAAFDRAHDLIATSFTKLMAPISHLMPPKKA